MLDSFFYSLGQVRFPAYAGRQQYMHKFDPHAPTMPAGMEEYIPMISFLTWEAEVTDPVFVTIDEKIIQPGMSQRRPGPHVDGCFREEKPKVERVEPRISDILPEKFDGQTLDEDRDATVEDLRGKGIFKGMPDHEIDHFLNGPYGFNGGGWGHASYGSGWNHHCNAVPFKRMPVIVASTVVGCRAWYGQFDAEPRNDGDLSHIWEQLGEGTILPANEAFLLSPDCIHESMIFNSPTQRQFIRIALPVDTVI